MADVTKTTVSHNLDVFALTSAVDQLGAVVEHAEKLNGAIYTAALTTSFLAAKRLGAEWQGTDAEKAKATFSATWKQFALVYVERGHTWFRDSEEAMNKIRSARGKPREKATREYFAEFRGAKLVEGPAKVSKFARAIFQDAAVNHADVIRTIAGMESAAGRVEAWTNFVRDQYGASLRALEAYFAKPPKEKGDAFDSLLDKLDTMGLDMGQVQTLLDKLNRMKSEMLELKALLSSGEGDEGEGEGEELRDAA